MGFFQKLKDNFKKGGVKVELKSPGNASFDDTSIPVIVTITNGDTQRNIMGIKIVLEREIIRASGSGKSNRYREDLNAYNIPGSTLQLQPGETKSFAVNFPLSTKATLDNAGVESEAAHAVADVLDKVSNVVDQVKGANARYSLKAVADVEGITLDPSDSNGISINRLGEFGTTISLT